MANGSRRVKTTTDNRAHEMVLQQLDNERATVLNDIVFVIESSGVRVDRALAFDYLSAQTIEKIYRSLVRSRVLSGEDLRVLERLMGIFLGELIILQNKNATWAIYRGPYSVYSPIGIELDDNKFVDVFLFCDDLQGKSVAGREDCTALECFVRDAGKLSTPMKRSKK